MPGTDRSPSWDEISCDAVRQGLARARTLTAAELAHVEVCESCLDAWLDATVTQSLDAKPEVWIPADFAARVVERLPDKRSAVRRTPHWGLITAVLLVAAGLIATAVADPSGVNTRMGMILMTLVVTEIAGIALWLGVSRPGGVHRGF